MGRPGIKQPSPNFTHQKKLSTEPPGLCANEAKHGPQENGRKDHLCTNCGKFADLLVKRTKRK